MNDIKEALRLFYTTKMSLRKIARLTNIKRPTLTRYVKKLSAEDIEWDAVKVMNDIDLQKLLVLHKGQQAKKRMADLGHVHKQMQMPDMTMRLAWEEYALENPNDAYSYSHFTRQYRDYIKKVDVSMRQTHKAGDTVFVDYAGRTVPYFDKATNQKRTAQIFVGVLGCSNYTFVFASKSQKLPDWIDAHNQMFQYFGGVPQTVVPDNLKSAITKAGTEPVINRTYQELARHYHTSIVPARVRKPKDKAKAENAVLIVSRWILARLRHRQFFSVHDINQAIMDLLIQLNQRKFKKLPGCRLSRFEELDKPLLQSLPETPFEFAEWTSLQKVGPDYHVEVKGHYYSVPNQLVGVKVDARCTASTVEIYHAGIRVASHAVSQETGGHTTKPEHQTSGHRRYGNQTYQSFRKWAKQVGPHTEAFVEAHFDTYSPSKALSKCSVLQRLAKQYQPHRVEKACELASELGSKTVTTVKSLLVRDIDIVGFQPVPSQMNLPLHHENIRGGEYYSKEEPASC